MAFEAEEPPKGGLLTKTWSKDQSQKAKEREHVKGVPSTLCHRDCEVHAPCCIMLSKRFVILRVSELSGGAEVDTK